MHHRGILPDTATQTAAKQSPLQSTLYSLHVCSSACGTCGAPPRSKILHRFELCGVWMLRRADAANAFVTSSISMEFLGALSLVALHASRFLLGSVVQEPHPRPCLQPLRLGPLMGLMSPMVQGIMLCQSAALYTTSQHAMMTMITPSPSCMPFALMGAH